MDELIELTISEFIKEIVGVKISFVYEKFILTFEKHHSSAGSIYINQHNWFTMTRCFIRNLNVDVIAKISEIKNFISTINLTSLPEEVYVSISDKTYIYKWELCCTKHLYTLKIADHYDINTTEYINTTSSDILTNPEIQDTHKVFEVIYNCILSIYAKSAGIIQGAWREHVMRKRKKAALKVIIEFGLRPGHIIAKKVIARLNANR
jgi:hypothetical protein